MMHLHCLACTTMTQAQYLRARAAFQPSNDNLVHKNEATSIVKMFGYDTDTHK